MKRNIVLCMILLVCLVFLSGCAGTPSIPGGLSITIRILSRTAYTATIEMSLWNRSSQSFSYERIIMKACNTAGLCISEEELVPPGSAIHPPLSSASTIEVIPIGSSGHPRLAWMEVIVEGRFSDGSFVSASSGRVRF